MKIQDLILNFISYSPSLHIITYFLSSLNSQKIYSLNYILVDKM